MTPLIRLGGGPSGSPFLAPLTLARVGVVACALVLVLAAVRAGSAPQVARAAGDSAMDPTSTETPAAVVHDADVLDPEDPRAEVAGPGVQTPRPVPTQVAPDPGARETVDPQVLEYAARQAPFHPQRDAPGSRYVPLADRRAELPEPPPVVREEAPVPAFQLHGVVATAGGGSPLVILSVDGNAPMVLSEGDEMGGYRVAQVVGTSALLSGGGRNLRVSVADPSPEGPAVVPESATGRALVQRGNAAAQQRQSAQQQSQQQQALQRMVETRARELRQQLGDQGTVRVDGDRIIVTTPDGRNMMIERVSPPQPRPGGGR
jgi:hypothetical protein